MRNRWDGWMDRSFFLNQKTKCCCVTSFLHLLLSVAPLVVLLHGSLHSSFIGGLLLMRLFLSRYVWLAVNRGSEEHFLFSVEETEYLCISLWDSLFVLGRQLFQAHEYAMCVRENSYRKRSKREKSVLSRSENRLEEELFLFYLLRLHACMRILRRMYAVIHFVMIVHVCFSLSFLRGVCTPQYLLSGCTTIKTRALFSSFFLRKSHIR